MTATVDPLLPLSLLEAVRAVDTPSGEHEAEFVHELRNKRLGLSDTVFAQIKRYTEAVRRNQRPPFDEAVALGTLDYFVVCCPKDVTMYEDAIKTSGNAERIELRELTELIEEALLPAGALL